jgi:hypothetical protein
VHSFLVLMTVVFFLLTLKYVLSSCSCASFIKEEPLRDSVYVLFREVVIVACGAILVQAMSFYGIITLDKTQIIGSSYCLLLAIAIWTSLGLIMILAAQHQVK